LTERGHRSIMDNMTVIEFPEHPRLKRAKAILALVEEKIKRGKQLNAEVDTLMMEYNLIMLQIAPVEIEKLAAHFATPQQLELNF
jgi:hypothetical protein